MGKKDFYFFRHAKSEMNQKDIWCGATHDPGLDAEKGVSQAEDLAKRLAGRDIELFVSSPLTRAVKTAEIAASELGCDVIVENDLLEVNYGVAEGKPVKEVFDKYSEIARAYFYPQPDKLDYCFENGESLQRASDRARNVMAKLAGRSEKSMAIATHAGFMVVLLCNLGVLKVDVHNCDCFHIIYEDGDWKVEEWF